MPTIKLLYRNCNCCSGSGSSGSGSGSSGAGCACQFFKGHPCEGSPVDTCNGSTLTATVTFNFSDCAGSKWSQCSGSGSTGKLPGTGGDFTGSGSGSCSQTCPSSCCDLLPRKTFTMLCVGTQYFSDNLFDVAAGDPGFVFDSSCAGYRTDKKAWLYFGPADGADTLAGAMFIPIDGFGLTFLISDINISYTSCNPLQINIIGICNTPGDTVRTMSPCLAACMDEQYAGLCCVKANIVITE